MFTLGVADDNVQAFQLNVLLRARQKHNVFGAMVRMKWIDIAQVKCAQTHEKERSERKKKREENSKCKILLHRLESCVWNTHKQMSFNTHTQTQRDIRSFTHIDSIAVA